MTWMLTQSGEEYSLATTPISITANQPVFLADIANALAKINRFTGHTSRLYSVAEHSLLVCHIALRHFKATPAQALLALWHDAHEAYTGDLSTPGKQAVNELCWQSAGPPAWAAFEQHHERHVLRSILPEPLGRAYTSPNQSAAAAEAKRIVKWSDLTALYIERRDLLPYNPAIHQPWDLIDNAEHAWHADIQRIAACFTSISQEIDSWQNMAQDMLKTHTKLQADFLAQQQELPA